MTRAGHSVFAVFCLLFFAFSYIHYQSGGGNHNTHARLDVLHSIFINHTINIDRYQENTTDKAFYDGHYYSSKPPGLTVLAAPGFAIAILIIKMGGLDTATQPGWNLINWITTVLSVGILAALGGMTFFVLLKRFLSERMAFLATLGVFLGSLPFPYSTVFFGHGATLGLLMLALYAILRKTKKNRERMLWDSFAGLCMGFAIATEYVSVIAVTGLLLYALTRDLRRGPVLIACMIPPLLLIPLYSWLCFGTPWTIGYAHEVRFPDMVKTGIFGIHPPSLSRHLQMLFSPEKGLFFWTPFFFLAIPGFITLWKKDRALFWLTLGITIVHIAVVGSHRSVLGGQGISARNYMSVIPFLGLAAAIGMKRFPRVGFAAVILSIAMTASATVISAFPDEGTRFPFTDFYLPKIQAGTVMPNLGYFLGLQGLLSIALFLVFMGVLIGILWRDLPKTAKISIR